MIKYIIGYLTVFIIIFCIFGLTILTSNVFKNKIIKKYLLQILSLIIFIIVYVACSSNIRILIFKDLFTLTNILLALLAVIPTVIIVYYGDKSKPDY